MHKYVDAVFCFNGNKYVMFTIISCFVSVYAVAWMLFIKYFLQCPKRVGNNCNVILKFNLFICYLKQVLTARTEAGAWFEKSVSCSLQVIHCRWTADSPLKPTLHLASTAPTPPISFKIVFCGTMAQLGPSTPHCWTFKISGIQPAVSVPPGVREDM
jgi:hypothetical protein